MEWIGVELMSGGTPCSETSLILRQAKKREKRDEKNGEK
jgi:hypothetical protein